MDLLAARPIRPIQNVPINENMQKRAEPESSSEVEEPVKVCFLQASVDLVFERSCYW
jgi:hypothetical protein